MKKGTRPSPWMALILAGTLAAGCGGDEGDGRSQVRAAPASGGEAALTAFELEHGIGPFTSAVELGPIDPSLAARGQDIYEMNCLSCHRLVDRFVGPPLGEVLTHRSPTYVLNMIMNPMEMTRRHPEARALLAEYMTIMPYQNITEEEAKAILEYLRTVQR